MCWYWQVNRRGALFGQRGDNFSLSLWLWDFCLSFLHFIAFRRCWWWWSVSNQRLEIKRQESKRRRGAGEGIFHVHSSVSRQSGCERETRRRQKRCCRKKNKAAGIYKRKRGTRERRRRISNYHEPSNRWTPAISLHLFYVFMRARSTRPPSDDRGIAALAPEIDFSIDATFIICS